MLHPDWPVPAGIHGLMTIRIGGVSVAPWDSFNLGDHVGDEPGHVARNRERLVQLLPNEPVWLRQTHGIAVVEAGSGRIDADAAFTRQAGVVCAVLTADCLPVLLCDRAGSVVAAAHAGWRGLADGVLEATITAMQVPPSELLVWLGAAIGPQAFEVGDEVRQAFIAQDPAAARAFAPHPVTGGEGKWQADLYQLARNRLHHAGVHAIYGGGLCTFTDAERFYSYRRDGVTGRMATVIWRD